MAFYKEDIEEIRSILRTTRESLGAAACMLLHRSGHPVATEGTVERPQADSLEQMTPGVWRDLKKLAATTADSQPSCNFRSGLRTLEAILLEPQCILVCVRADEVSGPAFLNTSAYVGKMRAILARISRRGDLRERTEPFGLRPPPPRQA